MLKRLINYIRREDEIASLRRAICGLHIIFNHSDENNRREIHRLNEALMMVQVREELLVEAVGKLQERNVYEQ
jgi:hypothetical protein